MIFMSSKSFGIFQKVQTFREPQECLSNSVIEMLLANDFSRWQEGCVCIVIRHKECLLPRSVSEYLELLTAGDDTASDALSMGIVKYFFKLWQPTDLMPQEEEYSESFSYMIIRGIGQEPQSTWMFSQPKESWVSDWSRQGYAWEPLCMCCIDKYVVGVILHLYCIQPV